MKAKIAALLLIVLMLTAFATLVSGESLWKPNSTSPYYTQKSLRSGDVVTILIVETSSASHKAGTDTYFKDDLAASFTHNINRLSSFLAPGTKSLSGNASNKYKGTGATTRTSNVQAKVAVTVYEILPNGNLRVSGSHKVKVNDETQEMVISGVIRPGDISPQNTVYSYQVADANIEVKGSGVVDSGSQPGWITRVLNWIF
jgi:flagellar L-ring protein FlgH